MRYTFSLFQLMTAMAGAAVFFACLAWALKVNAWWWAAGAFQCSIHFFPRFAWVAAGGSVGAFIAAAADRSVWRLRSLWLLLPIAVPILLLWFGIVFQNGGTAASSAARAKQVQFVVDAFPWAILPIMLIVLGSFRSVSNWVMVGGISTAAYWLALGAQAVSWMSVTNDWL